MRHARYTSTVGKSVLSMTPAEYFERQIYVTFVNDPTLGSMLEYWGLNKCMWSNDFPHAVTSWPSSRQTIDRDFGHMAREDRELILSKNVSDMYPALKNLQPLTATSN